MIRVLELFAGIGTQSMALKNIGIEHTSIISEIDKFAIKSYNAIHGDTENLGDICLIETLPQVDLLTYSFPCQDISLAGKAKGFSRDANTRSGLLWEVERLLLCSDKPKYLLMENVKAIVNKKNKPHFDEWCQSLEDMGYTNYWQVLNAKDYGVPQNRERVFVVSILGDHTPYVFPEKQELTLRLKDVLEAFVDDKYYCDGASRWIQSTASQYAKDHGYVSIDGDVSSCITARGIVSYNCQYVTDKIIVETTAFMPSIETDYRIRKLTPKECWRLMGISDSDFEKAQVVNSNSQLTKQAGNAIVVDVLEAIFTKLFKG
jgi:DNA (cytosine-5)-methyltransferase 1